MLGRRFSPRFIGTFYCYPEVSWNNLTRIYLKSTINGWLDCFGYCEDIGARIHQVRPSSLMDIGTSMIPGYI